ncbi:CYP302A1 [Cordylochernes scorpioides]|uniref:CYP302A1 n=1 Tax=Cordylochernes scorpioides TaxID=51811 RepID=A0ABY6LQ42_9ARAC|nr:CYP302A1 [Cordylochernes scorpioides]
MTRVWCSPGLGVKMARPFCMIPGPRGLPVIGNNWQFWPIVGKYSKCRHCRVVQGRKYSKCRHCRVVQGRKYSKERMHEPLQALRQRYGPVVKEKVVSGRNVVHLFDPADMMAVYNCELRYPLRVSHRAILQFRLSRPHVYSAGGGLLPSRASDVSMHLHHGSSNVHYLECVKLLLWPQRVSRNGEEWRRLRQPFAKLLLDPREAVKQLAAVQEVSVDLVRNLLAKVHGPWDFSQDLHLWALECVGKVALNARLGCLEGRPHALRMVEAASDTHMGVMVTENGLQIHRLFPTPAYRKLVRAQAFMEQQVRESKDEMQVRESKDEMQVREYIQPTLEQVRNGRCTRDSLLESMLQLETVDDKDVFTMIMDMFLAGIDTTSYSIGYLLYNLAIHPEIQEKCRQEVMEAMGSEKKLTEESLRKLTYLRMCIKESNRLYPISLGVGRILSQPIDIKDYQLEPGKIDMDPEQQLYTPKIVDIATAVIERDVWRHLRLFIGHHNNNNTVYIPKIENDCCDRDVWRHLRLFIGHHNNNNTVYTPKIVDIAAAVIEMHGDI